MAIIKNAQEVLADKEAYYESVTRLIRWLAIAMVALTFPPSHPLYHDLLLAVAAAIVFNGLRYSAFMRYRIFASRITTLIADNALIAILLVLSGGIASPYFLFWSFTLISAAYWYGHRGVIVVLVWQITTSLFMISQHTTSPAPNLYITAAIELISLIILAILAERLTHADRNERQVLSIANREVEAARRRMSALINSMAEAVIAIDSNGLVTVYNGAALDLLNTNQALTGKYLDDFLVLSDTLGVAVSPAELLTHLGVFKRDDLLLKLNEGSILNLDISIAPIHINDREDDGYIILLRDITKQKSLDQERDEFISVTSHELRTPVAIAEANLSTALLPSYARLDPKVTNLLEQAHQNIVFLGQLIKDLSTLARAERGVLKVDISQINPTSLIQQLASDYQASAHTRGLVIKVETTPKLKPIPASLNLVHEILQNFMTNALKYTERGTITLRAEPGPNQTGVIFSVSDTGIGISASDRKLIFSKFYRSEDYRTRKTKGTGLGLYITKRLAERMGADIWLKSRLNVGSTFSLALPAKPNIKPATSSSLEN